MRLRNIPGADEIVRNSDFFVASPRQYKGQWFRFLGNEFQIHIEIGCGKGQFLLEMARQNPHINYIGIERYTSVLLHAIRKAEHDPLPNVHFLCVDASVLPEIFEKGEIDMIYLNFSDPWPKDRHANRRLTSPDYLSRYAHILAEDGKIEFKTDQEALFDYTMDEIDKSFIWQIESSTRDLHNDEEMNQGNIMSEYEEKFSGLGHPIYKLIACYQDNACYILPPLPDISRQPNPWEDATNGPSSQEDFSNGSGSQEHPKDSGFPDQPEEPQASEQPSGQDCLKVTAWCEGQIEERVYSYVVRLEHTGHQSYGQTFSLYFHTPIYIVEVPGDTQAWTDNTTLTVTRNNQLTDNGLTELWIKLSADSYPEFAGIGNVSCRH